MSDHPRNASGAFVSRQCPDVRCNGRLQPEAEGWWRCDGLTFDRDDGPLRACEVAHHAQFSPDQEHPTNG